jgi:hypothetical protein
LTQSKVKHRDQIVEQAFQGAHRVERLIDEG